MSKFSDFMDGGCFTEIERVYMLTGAALVCDDLVDYFQREGADCESAACTASCASDVDYYDGRTRGFYDASHIAKTYGDSFAALGYALLKTCLHADDADFDVFGGGDVEAL